MRLQMGSFLPGVLAILSLLVAPVQSTVNARQSYVVTELVTDMSATVETVHAASLPTMPDGLSQSAIVSIIESVGDEKIGQGFGCGELYEASNLALVECLAAYADPETVTPQVPELDPCASFVLTTPGESVDGVIDSENSSASTDGDPSSQGELEDLDDDSGNPPSGTPDCPHATCILTDPVTGECIAWVSLCPPPAGYDPLKIEEITIGDRTVWIVISLECPPADEDCDLVDAPENLIEDLLDRLAGYGYGSAADGRPCGNTQPEQYREGAGSASQNPVLIAEGVKTDRASDIHIPLRGTDFELTRHYNAGDLARSDDFPWMVGPGWGLSTDGWISVTPDEDLGDMITITTYPLETSERYIGVPGTNTGTFDPMGPSTTLVRTRTVRLALYGTGDGDLNHPGSIKPFSTYTYDDPGKGQVTFFRTKYNPDYEHLHGRIAQRHDASGNVWTYRYVRHTDENDEFTDPRLLAIYLNHRIGLSEDGGCDARVVFDWDIGTVSEPGTGMVRSVRAERPIPNGSGGTDWEKVQSVEYIYSTDSVPDGVSGEMSSDLVASGVTSPRLVMVERSQLVNAPLTDELVWPAEQNQEWHRVYSMYRYGGVGGRMSHEFRSRELEYFAEHSGSGFQDIREACVNLLTMSLTDQSLLNSYKVEELASKIIAYYEIPSEKNPSDWAWPDAPGYPWGALEGKVKSEVLQSACGCGGSGASFDRKIGFKYARKDILDFVSEVTASYIDINGILQTVTAVLPHPRNMSLTKQIESVRSAEGWISYKRVSQWSYDEVYRLSYMNSPDGPGIRFRVIPVPFTILNRVEEYMDPEEEEPSGRVWWSYMEFENHLLARTFPTTALGTGSAIDVPVELDEHGLIDYEPDINTDPTEHSNPGVVVTINAGSIVPYTKYDELGRTIETGIARTGVEDTADEVTLTHYPTRTKSYIHPGGDNLRTDLVSEVRDYSVRPLVLDGSGPHYDSNPSEYVSSQTVYLTENSIGLMRPKVVRVGTIQNREKPSQNGPTPAEEVSSWVGLDDYGQAIWSADAAGRVTTTAYDVLTGAAIAQTRNADPTATIPSQQMPPSEYTSGWPTYSSSEATALTTAKVDVMGRTRLRVSESGVATATHFTLGNVPSAVSEPGDVPTETDLGSYLQVTTLPPALSTGGFSGPAVRQWVDASYNVLQSSSYSITAAAWSGTPYDSLLTGVTTDEEHTRTVHVYGLEGNLREKLTWHDLDNVTASPYYSERFSYDPYGRLTQSLSANHQLTLTGYDIKDRPIKVWGGAVTVAQADTFPFDFNPLTGTDEVTTVQLLSETVYDAAIPTSGTSLPASGVGDGLPTIVRTYAGSGIAPRDQVTIYDWRYRPRISYTTSGTDWNPYPNTTLSVSELDNLDRPTKSIEISRGADVTVWPTIKGGIVNDSLDTDAITSDAVIGRSETLYSDRGSVYRIRSALDPDADPSDPSSKWSITNIFYDALGRTLASVGPDGPISKPTFDGLGRTVRTITTSGEEARGGALFEAVTEADPASVNAPVLEISLTDFDPITHLPVRSSTQQRAHDATGNGIGANPVTTYSTTGYDSANRPVWSASYGTNAANYASGGSEPSLAKPTSSENVIVSETQFDAIGRAHLSVDNKGRKFRSYFDALGRVVASVDNYVEPGSGSLVVSWDGTKEHYVVTGREDTTPATGSDKNRVTSMVYDGAGNVVRRVAHLLDGDSSAEEKHQVTEFVYDFFEYEAGSGSPALVNNQLESHGFLYEIRYPDPVTGVPSDAAQDVVRFAYNLTGEQIERRDQNGTTLVQARDHLGRITSETAILDSGAPTHLRDEVNGIATAYDAFGRVEKISSLGGTNIVNELLNVFDNRGRLTGFYQSHHGPVDTNTTDFVEYTYTDLDRYSDYNYTSRLDALLYPTESRAVSGRTALTHIYDANALDDELARLSGISWAGELPNQAQPRAISHTYLGMSRRVKSIFGDTAGLALGTPSLVRDRTIDPATGTATPGQYPALDPLGRVSRHIWSLGDHAPASGPALFNLSYEYDKTSNIIARLDSRAGSQSDIRHTTYRFDEIDRLTDSVRSSSFLSVGVKGSQSWTLDAHGNWINRVRQLGGSQTEDEDRQFDATNEITSLLVNGTTSRDYEYDDAGNLIAQQLVDALGLENRRVYEYDAWNRLVQVGYQTRKSGQPWSPTNIVTSYSYFGNNFRATRTASSTSAAAPDTRHRFFYDTDWMLLEEREADISGLPTVSWHPGEPGFESGAAHTVRQYIWDPTAQDELASVQVGTLSGSDWVFGERWWSLTDRNHNLVGMIQEVWDAASSAFRLRAEGHERVRYGPYGFAERQLLADGNADGSVDLADLNAVYGANNASISNPSSGYRAELDVDASGVIDAADQNTVTAAFGTSAPTDGSLWLNAPGTVGFGAGLYDPLAGLYLFRNRWYDPTEGRWITRDPAGYVDGLNLYQYVQGNPLMYFDPFGLSGIMLREPVDGGTGRRSPGSMYISHGGSSEAINRAMGSVARPIADVASGAAHAPAGADRQPDARAFSGGSACIASRALFMNPDLLSQGSAIGGVQCLHVRHPQKT